MIVERGTGKGERGTNTIEGKREDGRGERREEEERAGEETMFEACRRAARRGEGAGNQGEWGTAHATRHHNGIMRQRR